jgi:putative membrane protein
MNRKTCFGVVISLLVLSLAGANCQAQSNGSDADKNLLLRIAQANDAEIQLARLAEQRGQSSAVKQFAEKMVRDHGGAAAEDIGKVVNTMGVDKNIRPNAEQQQTMQRLSNLKGAEFDQAYSQAMVKDHQEVIGMFEQASNSSNADLKKLAQTLLPVLRMHLELAQKLPNG